MFAIKHEKASTGVMLVLVFYVSEDYFNKYLQKNVRYDRINATNLAAKI